MKNLTLSKIQSMLQLMVKNLQDIFKVFQGLIFGKRLPRFQLQLSTVFGFLLADSVPRPEN